MILGNARVDLLKVSNNSRMRKKTYYFLIASSDILQTKFVKIMMISIMRNPI